MLKHNTKKGFTLIEFVLYIGLVVILLTALGAISLNIFFNNAKLTGTEEVNYVNRFALEAMTQIIARADSIQNISAGATSSILTLQMASSTENPVVFDLASGTLRFQKGVGTPIPLSTGKVSVSNLIFSNISYPNTTGTIRVEFTTTYRNSSNLQEYNVEKSVRTSVTLRKSS